ncbi:hypothetical protein CFAL_01925 [Corynebacterium falsenii DSM 44353]|nr:hypothetical protein CFAL_01925 [Corynebacterium falsenii DSM 44353]
MKVTANRSNLIGSHPETEPKKIAEVGFSRSSFS